MSFRRQNGYTLVEAIIYVSILAVVSVVVVYALLVMVRSYFDFRQTRNLTAAATTVMERISYEARQSYEIDLSSALNAHPGTLVLKQLDADNNVLTVTVAAAGSDLTIDTGAGAASLLPPYVDVTSLIFRRITTANTQAVKVELTLTDTRRTGKIVNLMSTIGLRGSYVE